MIDWIEDCKNDKVFMDWLEKCKKNNSFPILPGIFPIDADSKHKDEQPKPIQSPKYKVGDKVKIVNFGHPIFISKNSKFTNPDYPTLEEKENYDIVDMSSGIVGKVGVVKEVQIHQGVPEYTIEGIKGKCAWFVEEQMELVN